MMMKATGPLVQAAGAALGAVAAISCLSQEAAPDSAARATQGTKAAAAPERDMRLRDYRHWTRVNPKPFRMESAPAYLCAAVPAQQPSPHLNKYATVYVNPAGRAAMMGRKPARFPLGAAIIKEKRSDRGAGAPELMTAMVKREKGYNPGNGDWEYLVLDGAGERVTARGKLENCQSCHASQPARGDDFVYRAKYLPKR